MRTQIGLLSLAAFLGWVTISEAASLFDGNYQLTSSTKVVQTFLNRGGQMGFCPDRQPSPLTIMDGRAQYTTETGVKLEAPVEPNGQFEMRHVAAGGSGTLRALGTIDGNFTVRMRQMGNSCSYDFVWQKQS